MLQGASAARARDVLMLKKLNSVL